MWRCPLGLLLLLLLAGELALGAQRGRGRRELAPALHLRGIRDAGGRYCQEQDLCCRGRADDCALPYLGATCYCDLFCNRTVSDCCPDFWDFCLGVPPPFPPIQGCMHRGRIYPVLGTYWDNCNRCTCQEKGQWECDQEPCLVDENMIKAINQGSYGWRAGNHSAFWGMTLDEGIRYRLGTIRPPSSVTNMNEIHTVLGPGEVLPRAFEASEKWPNLIHDPLDQGNCAGSWAFSTAAVASDRVSIHSLGHMTPVLSPQNLLSCDTHNQQGCRGGRLDGAWWFLRRRGVVSDHCYPFSGHGWDEAGSAPRCMMHSRAMGRGKRQATARCPNSYVHANDIYQVTPAYRLGSNEKEIMKELMENGPVQALMEVHEDFFLYQSGIYSHTPVSLGRPEQNRHHGTHSVKITGWGEETLADGRTLKYWVSPCAACQAAAVTFLRASSPPLPLRFRSSRLLLIPRRRPTPGAQPGERGATSASCAAPTSATSRASCWASGAAWEWRTWVTTEAAGTTPGRALCGAAAPAPPARRSSGPQGPNPHARVPEDAAPCLGASGR
ncbi:tubulointerstitial nephritis antigen-like isoform X1 [Physeter macrocephalus]|uniref:Tubulointerstitial nephritis antigen-like isoform X1 n=1 Tax=Physeter macrocephalus TaxID=9755 RepID=A0A2Y9FSZ5_PHYMC|nr:tubulointerstitial nephritis antigen-like isoform X1 [Physeter catodon]|eukprot:XP_007128524.1 tubulointerstitial nephritis antigen-like isoform X1 [Physeter catodon]